MVSLTPERGSVHGNLYAVEPNHGELDQFTPGRRASRISDISATQEYIVPTALAFHLGRAYLGDLDTFPGGAQVRGICRITPGGARRVDPSSARRARRQASAGLCVYGGELRHSAIALMSVWASMGPGRNLTAGESML
jgi:hypothetical protein